MKFKDPAQVDSICWQMRQSDYPRGKNRALINNLFNGVPPYSEDEALANNINVNVNDLSSTRVGHESRTQFYQAFQKPGNFFTCRTDTGVAHKRATYGTIVTKEVNRIMKRSLPYMETMRSKFAMDVLHGISPAGFRDSKRWRPDALAIEDVFVPAKTLLSMENLPFFAIRKTFTAPELIKLTNKAVADPGWNMPMVNDCVKWIDKESMALMGANWPDVWSPEKVNERVKGDGGFYIGDAVATISAFDFYFWSDEGGKEGWRRRIILDYWDSPAAGGAELTAKTDDFFSGSKGRFLYNPGDRVFATDISQIINWQFADLSAVAPFQYHSVRSLGFLLYAVCHLQNRMRCKFSESVFEQMLVYFRIKSGDDAQRALKVDLINRGFIDDTIDFVPANMRYQINAQLVELGLQENKNIISQNSASYTADNGSTRGNVEKTKFEVMAETTAMTSLVSAGLQQAYAYQLPEYRESFRRFTIKGSPDPEVRQFQSNCLSQGVPQAILYNPECWDLEPERTMGAGNKTMEMAIAQQLMQARNLYDPEAQRLILRDFTLAVTEDPARAQSYVPDSVAKITDSVHDAQLAAGTLMQGLPVDVKSGMNHVEYVDTLLHSLVTLVQQPVPPTPERINGLNMIANNISGHLQIIAQNPEEKQKVTQYQQQLSKIMNAVKAMTQKMQEQQQSQGGGQDPETQGKVQAMLIQAKAKAESGAQSHAQKTAQRQIQFEMEEKRKQEAFDIEKRRGMLEAGHEFGKSHLEHQHDLALRNSEAQAELEHQRALDEQALETQKQADEQKITAAKKAAAAKPKPAAKKKK